MKVVINFISVIYILISLLICASSYGQNHPRIKYFTLDDGLSQVTVLNLFKDSNEFVWIGTQNGLNRFDGHEFKHYNYNELDSTTISGNYITKLLGSHNGNLWVGTLDDGLNYYDQELDIFHRIKLGNKKNENITSLEIEENGTTWVASRKSGLYRLQSNSSASFQQDNFLNDKALSALQIDNQKKLWIGGFQGEVYKWDLSNLKNPPLSPKFKVQGNVQAFYKTNDGLLIGTDTGIFIYDEINDEVFPFELNSKGDSPIKHVTKFLKEGESKVWIGTGNGLFLFDWDAKKVLKKIQYNENETLGLSNNTVHSLLRITENQIFVGTANNLNLLDFKAPYFHNISKNKRGEHLLNDNVVFSILKDKDQLWIGTSDGGLNLISRGKTYYFKVDQNNPSSISGNVVREILKDTINQRLWLATSRGLSMIDLVSFDPNNPKFRVFQHDPNNSKSINNDFIKGIALDKNNNLWGATFGHGIFRLTLTNDYDTKVKRFKNDKGDPNSLINDFTQCILVDEHNTLWVGSQGGLSQLSLSGTNFDQAVFTNYTEDENDTHAISANSVYDITIDSKGKLWLATHYGLNLFLGDHKFKSWGKQKQNTNGIIYCIQHDESDKLWLGTTEGIVKFDPLLEDFKFYGVQDGIQSKEFDIHAKFKDRNGIIYLGGVAGVTFFHPKNLEEIDRPESLYFSQLRVRDEIVKPHNTTKPWLTSVINKTERLQFKNNEFPFYLGFSSIDYRLHKDVSFAYKLLPTDTEWNILKDPEIQFLNLPAGHYTLQVNGFSRGKEWEQEPLQMNLEILPPWWATWWAYIIYASIAVAFADRFYRFQLSKRLAVEESLRLKEVSQLKNSLYDNITHEFRTPLTVILGMTDSLESKFDTHTTPHIKNAVDMIRRNGKNLLSLVNEMLDLSKLESGHMETNLVQINVIPFIKYLGESFHSFAQEDDIHFTVYSEVDELIMDVDSHKLSTIISNLLSNAIKFTPALGKIVLHIHHENNTMLIIKVTDTGMGITKEELPHIFNRFYQVDATVTRKRDGTGIGLALTKELVNLLGGDISVDSTPNKGSVFKVTLPITQKAPKVTIESLKRNQKKSDPEIDFIGLQDNTVKNDENLPLVLIIEDNKDVSYYLKQCLSGYYHTIHAINGNIGLEMAFEHTPDIIISDVMMPGRDGYEVCSMLKKDERTDHIPIVLLTAKATTKDRVIGLTQGADAYLAKPFNKEELFTRLEQLLSLRKKLIHKFQQGQVTEVIAKQPKNAETKFIAKVINLIHEELDNSTFGIAQLSLKLRLSESQVYRKLKAITGKSTAVFIRTIRLESAKELLQNTDKSVSEIAYTVGFNDPSWFSRAFKEEYGYPPSDISN
ncbi:hybrid sensor histidine kinase/response regulator transcription factor [Maribacter sp. CXY002]|uniref:hybrid sensor histidine kinase/response regulator transcription factor n=1 Tax=Maribacter luteocoastalis TaxID=3407671 RepID=UPI003B66CB6C